MAYKLAVSVETFVYDFEFKQGADLDKTLTYKAAGVPVDLSYCAAWMVVRLKNASKTEVLRLSTDNGGIVLGGAAGTIQLLAPRMTTQKFVWDNATYTLHMTFANGKTVRLMEGNVTVSHSND